MKRFIFRLVTLAVCTAFVLSCTASCASPVAQKEVVENNMSSTSSSITTSTSDSSAALNSSSQKESSAVSSEVSSSVPKQLVASQAPKEVASSKKPAVSSKKPTSSKTTSAAKPVSSSPKKKPSVSRPASKPSSKPTTSKVAPVQFPYGGRGTYVICVTSQDTEINIGGYGEYWKILEDKITFSPNDGLLTDSVKYLGQGCYSILVKTSRKKTMTEEGIGVNGDKVYEMHIPLISPEGKIETINGKIQDNW